MSSSNILMRLKIGKLTGYYQENDKEVMNFIQQVFDKMVMKTIDKYPNIIYYVIDDKVYFEMKSNEQKRKNGYFYCRYEDFWKVLYEKFLLKYNDVQSLIKYMVEEHLKQEVGTPHQSFTTI